MNTKLSYTDLEARVRKLEEALEQRGADSLPASERSQLESLLDHSPDLILRVDRNLRYRYVNKAFLEATGLSKGQCLGRSNRDLDMPEPLCDWWEELFMRAFKTGSPEEGEFTYAGPAGPRHYHLRVVPEPDAKGNIDMVVAMARDITEQRLAQGEIRNLAKFPEENPNPVMRITRHGIILYANNASQPLLDAWGCQRGQAVPSSWKPFITALLEAGCAKKADVSYADRVLSLTWAPVKHATYINIYGLDVTDRKEMEEQLRKNAERLRKYQEDLEALVQERTQKLHCLYRLSKLIEENDTFEATMQKVPDLLIASGRYPAGACARVVIGEQEFRSQNFQQTPWNVSAPIMVQNKEAAWVEVCYPEDGPFLHEGPLVKEETELISAVAERLGGIVERARTREEIRSQWQKLVSVIDGFADSLYVSDPQTYEVLYANKALQKAIGRDPVGGLCYREFQGLDSPCDFCTNETILKERKPFVWEYHNPVLDRSYFLTDQIIEWPDGRDVRFEVAVDITRRKEIEEALRMSEKNLRLLSSKLVQAQEDERKWIARELHDDLGGKLAAIKYGLEKKLSDMQSGRDSSGISLERIISVTSEAIATTRTISSRLRPAIIDDLGALKALGASCRELERLHPGVRLKTHFGLEEDEVPEALKIVLYRISQEAITNALKYSESDLVDISVEIRNHSLKLVIEDNGRGFDTERISLDKCGETGMGLTNMRERAELSGGHFRMWSAPGKGTRVRVSWPLSRQER